MRKTPHQSPKNLSTYSKEAIMPLEKERSCKPGMVHVQDYCRKKPRKTKKTDETGCPNPTVFLMIAKADIKRWLSEL